MTKVDGRTRDRLLKIFGFHLGIFPIKYLGIPLAIEWLRMIDYSALIDSMVGCLTFYVENLELIRTGPQGIEYFQCSIMSISNGIVEKLYSICKFFVWM